MVRGDGLGARRRKFRRAGGEVGIWGRGTPCVGWVEGGRRKRWGWARVVRGLEKGGCRSAGGAGNAEVFEEAGRVCRVDAEVRVRRMQVSSRRLTRVA